MRHSFSLVLSFPQTALGELSIFADAHVAIGEGSDVVEAREAVELAVFGVRAPVVDRVGPSEVVQEEWGLVMDLCEHGDLDRRIKDSKPEGLPVREVGGPFAKMTLDFRSCSP